MDTPTVLGNALRVMRQPWTRFLPVLPWLDGLFYDLRFALRRLRRDRAFTLAAIAMLALAIGLNVTVFTVMDAMLFRGYPLVKRNDRLVYLLQTDCIRSTRSLDGLRIGRGRAVWLPNGRCRGASAIPQPGSNWHWVRLTNVRRHAPTTYGRVVLDPRLGIEPRRVSGAVARDGHAASTADVTEQPQARR